MVHPADDFLKLCSFLPVICLVLVVYLYIFIVVISMFVM